MRVNITKGFIGYIFLLALGTGCAYTGYITLDENLPSAIFGLALGGVLVLIGVFMAFRKN
jgi:hypothetical protein